MKLPLANAETSWESFAIWRNRSATKFETTAPTNVSGIDSITLNIYYYLRIFIFIYFTFLTLSNSGNTDSAVVILVSIFSTAFSTLKSNSLINKNKNIIITIS